MADSNSKLADFITKVPNWTLAIISFLSTVATFVTSWQANTGVWSKVLLAVVLMAGWLGCAHVAVNRITRRLVVIPGQGDQLDFSRWRPLALIGFFIIPLLPVVLMAPPWLTNYFYQQYQQEQSAAAITQQSYPRSHSPSKVVILVADFDGPRPQRYRVTETVLARLRGALEKYNDVKVEALGKAIREAQGSPIARAEGRKHNASILIWGWHGEPSPTVPLSVHFELLRAPKGMPELGEEARGQVREVSEPRSFALRTRVSQEMAY